jgi:squalene-associated FAD-dependent desaturase
VARLENVDAGTVSQVGIVGAGWAGLACALTLAEAGVRVSVFDAARTAGGRARRVGHAGADLDNGQHLLVGAYRETLALIERLSPGSPGLLRLPLRLDYPNRFRLAAPRLPAPWHLLAGLLGARGLARRERMQSLAFVLRLKRQRFALSVDTTVAALLARQPQAARRFLWEPLCLAALNTPPELASAQVFLNALRDSFARARADSDLLLPRVDLSALLPEPAIARIRKLGGEVHLAHRITRIEPAGAGYRLHHGDQASAHSQVVIAAAPRHAARLLPEHPELSATRRAIDAFEHEPILTTYLRYADPAAETRLPFPMLGLADGPGQWVFDRGATHGQRGWLSVIASCPREPVAATDIATQLTRELRLPEPQAIFSVNEKRATFRCVPDLERPGNVTPLPGLFLAGDYTRGPRPTDDYPATLEGAVRSGIACARAIMAT